MCTLHVIRLHGHAAPWMYAVVHCITCCMLTWCMFMPNLHPLYVLLCNAPQQRTWGAGALRVIAPQRSAAWALKNSTSLIGEKKRKGQTPTSQKTMFYKTSSSYQSSRNASLVLLQMAKDPAYLKEAILSDTSDANVPQHSSGSHFGTSKNKTIGRGMRSISSKVSSQ